VEDSLVRLGARGKEASKGARKKQWLIAAMLASLSLLLVPTGAGVAVAWIFNLWGTADLLNAFYQANHAGVLAGQLGATYFIPTVVVPLLLITHVTAFYLLVRPQPKAVQALAGEAVAS
jgi:hypothetical protein